MYLYRNTTKKHSQYSSGFSLIELMVSLTIFSIVITVSIGALFILIDANAKAQALYTATTNLSFAVDNITRNLRMGHDYYCGTLSTDLYNGSHLDCSGGSGIAFNREKDGTRVGYRLSGNKIEMNEGNGWVNITSEDVFITKFNIVAVGTAGVYSTSPDAIQPRLSVLIEGYVNNGLDSNTDFRLQTNVVQRTLNYY